MGKRDSQNRRALQLLTMGGNSTFELWEVDGMVSQRCRVSLRIGKLPGPEWFLPRFACSTRSSVYHIAVIVD